MQWLMPTQCRLKSKNAKKKEPHGVLNPYKLWCTGADVNDYEDVTDMFTRIKKCFAFRPQRGDL